MKLELKNSQKVNVKFSRFEVVGEKVYAVYVDAKGKEYKYVFYINSEKTK
jgi:hypothetical protein